MVYKTLPKKTIQALILHKRYVQAGMVLPSVSTKAFVVIAALLYEGGREHAEYHKVLFEVDPITKWGNHSKSNVVVSHLELQFTSQAKYVHTTISRDILSQEASNQLLSREATKPYFSQENNYFSCMGFGIP